MHLSEMEMEEVKQGLWRVRFVKYKPLPMFERPSLLEEQHLETTEARPERASGFV